MKRFALRIGVLGAVAALGGIAIAHAQRQDNPLDGPAEMSALESPPAMPNEPTLSGVNPSTNRPGTPGPIARPTPAVAAVNGHALRREAAYPPSVTPISPRAGDASGEPASPGDPFGLRTSPPEPSVDGPQPPTPAAKKSTNVSAKTTGISNSSGPEPPIQPEEPIVRQKTFGASDEPFARRETVDISDEAPAVEPPAESFEAPVPGVSSTDLVEPRRNPARLEESHPLEAMTLPEEPNRRRGLTPTETQPIFTSPGPSLGAPSVDDRPDAMGSFSSERGAEPGGAAAAVDGTGRPSADQHLEGVQSPQLSIQKFAPKEIQVGRPADFRVTVKNFGQTSALGVEVRDQIPRGSRLVDTEPPAKRGARGELVWQLGKLDPGKETTVEMRIMPLEEGEIGSVATVYFQADASARSFATRPQLVVEATAPRQVMIDEQATLSITISNTGTGTATGVVVEEHVPPCFQHPAGAELEYEVGTLAPKESRTLELKLAAVRPGSGANVLVARGEGVAPIKKDLPIEVIAPALKLAMDGPASRFLQREATYRVAVSNPGSAPARDVRLEAVLPAGFQFVRANNNGHFDPKTRTVQWALAELPVNETGMVELTALPVEIGRQTLSLRGTAEKAIEVTGQQQVLVDGIAAIRFEVVDVQDPIEVGSETTYEIRVLNQGSKEATDVRVTVELPQGMRPVAAEGPEAIDHSLAGDRIEFAPLLRLSPKVDVTYRIRVQGRQAGDQRVRVLLQTAQMQTPVTKEESTRVFSDR